MAGRDSAKYSRNAEARRYGVVVGGALSAFVAAAAMATGSAAPAKADFEDLLDPIIQPLLTSFTDSISAFDPAAAVDITSWTDSLLASLNTSFDFAVPSAAEPAAALAAATVEAPTPAEIPLSLAIDTEPTVGATVDGAGTTLLVDTGSSGLVVPLTDLGSTSTQQLTNLFDLGSPVSFGESGYSGGVDYLYLTYNSVPVDYDLGGTSTLDTSVPVEVEVYSWDPSNFGSFFTNDAFQSFLVSDHVTGILGIGDAASGSAGVSPLEAAGYDGVTVDIPQHELFVGDATNPGTAIGGALANSGATPTATLTETVFTSGGQQIGTSPVSDDIDSGGVYGTIPSSISSTTLAQGDIVKVYDGNTELYQYTVGTDSVPQSESPTPVAGTSIDSGVEPFLTHPVFLDYTHHTISIDNLLSLP
jgi:hypothetical protein